TQSLYLCAREALIATLTCLARQFRRIPLATKRIADDAVVQSVVGIPPAQHGVAEERRLMLCEARAPGSQRPRAHDHGSSDSLVVYRSARDHSVIVLREALHFHQGL